MANPTLPVEPDGKVTRQKSPDLRKVTFGGYTQRGPKDINGDPETWTVQWQQCRKARIQAVLDLMDERAGYKPFLWTPPGQTAPRKFICESWGEEYPYGPASDIVNLSLTFVEDQN